MKNGKTFFRKMAKHFSVNSLLENVLADIRSKGLRGSRQAEEQPTQLMFSFLRLLGFSPLGSYCSGIFCTFDLGHIC